MYGKAIRLPSIITTHIGLQTLSTVQWFFVAMILFPEVQKRAQEELMAVVGPHRLPDFEDEESLPYIRALTKECLRWRSASPLGVPHRVLEDDEYRGYRIPKGSMVIYNVWQVHQFTIGDYMGLMKRKFAPGPIAVGQTYTPTLKRSFRNDS